MEHIKNNGYKLQWKRTDKEVERNGKDMKKRKGVNLDTNEREMERNGKDMEEKVKGIERKLDPSKIN